MDRRPERREALTSSPLATRPEASFDEGGRLILEFLRFKELRVRVATKGQRAAAITRTHGIVVLATAVYVTFVLTLGSVGPICAW
jgi:hypothetical protein